MDDIRPPRQSGTPNYGRQPVQPSQQPQQPNSYTTQQPQQSSYDYQQYNVNTVKTDKSNKHSKKKVIWNILVFIAFIALVAFNAYQYMQIQTLEEDIAELKADSARLIQKIDSLEYDNRDLYNQLELQKASYDELLDTAEQLKTTCGSACSSIELPE